MEKIINIICFVVLAALVLLLAIQSDYRAKEIEMMKRRPNQGRPFYVTDSKHHLLIFGYGRDVKITYQGPGMLGYVEQGEERKR